jgi:transposase
MRGEKLFLMTQKQLNRFHVINMVIDKKMTNKEAAASLGLSVRQIIRLKKGVIKEGPSFLIHKNKGRKPAHALSEKIINKIITLKKSVKYSSANFLHFQELLQEHENITISYNALFKILNDAGIKSPKKHRKTKIHHRRKRRSKEGQLIQMDASPFDWFNNNQMLDLHGAIDDATGKVVGLCLAKNECLQGYFETVRQLVTNHGIPISLYTDRHTIFRSPKADKLSIDEQLAGKTAPETQFSRAMHELGVTIIPARSPQAKGRIERLWNTLQSRLPIEFKIANITTIDQANDFFKSYIPKFNAKFSVPAYDTLNAYRSINENLNLENILCVKEHRILDNGLVFSFYNKHFKIISNNSNSMIYPKTKIKVLVSPMFGIKAQYGEKIFEVTPFIKREKSTNGKSKNNIKYIPSDDHYFKYGKKAWPKLSFEDSDYDILKMLEKIFLSKYA